ncbi:hypothetical protein [Brevibacterium album]|uniref:hypothetical protein n=1 Tax=Brevibacterium album TaxID=417948 RepID=UPI0003F7D6F6|nr:hypothetical protein [Brevibacterium album]
MMQEPADDPSQRPPAPPEPPYPPYAHPDAPAPFAHPGQGSPHAPPPQPPTSEGWRERGAALLERGRSAAAEGTRLARRSGEALTDAAGRTAGAAREGWQQRVDLRRQAADRMSHWAGSGAAAADAVIGTASAQSAQAWERGSTAYASAVSVPVDAHGRAVRPWEVRAAAVLGLIAPVFIVIAVVTLAVSGGRSLRILGFMLQRAGSAAEAEAITATGEVSTGLANLLVGLGIAAGVLVIAAFAVYVWRVLTGRGRARWIALAAMVLAFFFVTPLSPVLSGCFLLVGAASLVCAFMPRSTAWFARERAGSQKNRTLP